MRTRKDSEGTPLLTCKYQSFSKRPSYRCSFILRSGIWNPVLRKTLSHPDALHSNRHKVKSTGDQPDAVHLTPSESSSASSSGHQQHSHHSFMSTLTSGIPTLTTSKSVKLSKGRINRESTDPKNNPLALDTRLASTGCGSSFDPVSAPPSMGGLPPLLPPRKESKSTFLHGFRNPLRSKKSSSSSGSGSVATPPPPPSPPLLNLDGASLNVDLSPTSTTSDHQQQQQHQQQLSPGMSGRRWSECGQQPHHPKT